MLRIIIACLLLSSLFYSCIKEVQLDYDSLPQKIVVNGLITPDSLFKVRVTLSSEMDAEKELVNTAKIKLFINGVYSTTLSAMGKGWYQGSYPSPDIRYRVEVEVPGYEMVYAETSIPKYPEIVDTFYEKASEIPDEYNYYTPKTTIYFQDDPNENNYYHAGPNNYFNDNTKEVDPSILSESDLNYDPLYYFFSDALFNGTLKNLTLMSGGIISHSPFGDDYIFYQDNYTREFGPVSKEYFLGIKSWTQHYYNQSNDSDINDPLTLLFLGDPSEMYSNVHGGYGVFAGYNLKKLEISGHK